MALKVIGYNAFGTIDIEIDGAAWTIPDDLANADRRLVAEWEDEGNIIPAYAKPEPSTDPADYPLNRFQFEAFVLNMGLSFPAIEASIDALPIADFDKAVAKSRLRNATTYNRGHPLVEQLRAQMKMPVAQLDAAWMQAKDLR